MTGPGPHTDADEVLAQALADIIELNKADLQLDDVLYGNHNMIPHASAAIVMPMGKVRTLAGGSAPGGRTQNDLRVTISLLWSKVGDETTERKACDARATALEAILHQDTTVGGLIIHGFVNQVERGESPLAGGIGNNGMFRSVIMMYSGVTKTYLSP